MEEGLREDLRVVKESGMNFGGQATYREMLRYRIKRLLVKLGVIRILLIVSCLTYMLYYIFIISKGNIWDILADFFSCGNNTLASIFALLAMSLFCGYVAFYKSEVTISQEYQTWRLSCSAQTEGFCEWYLIVGSPKQINGEYYTEAEELYNMEAEERLKCAKKDFAIYTNYIYEEEKKSRIESEGKKYVEKPMVKIAWDPLVELKYMLKCPNISYMGWNIK